MFKRTDKVFIYFHCLFITIYLCKSLSFKSCSLVNRISQF